MATGVKPLSGGIQGYLLKRLKWLTNEFPGFPKVFGTLHDEPCSERAARSDTPSACGGDVYFFSTSLNFLSSSPTKFSILEITSSTAILLTKLSSPFFVFPFL